MQKLKSSSFPSTQNPAIPGTTSLVCSSSACILAHWLYTKLILVSPEPKSDAMVPSSSVLASCYDNHSLSGSWVGCGWAQFFFYDVLLMLLFLPYTLCSRLLLSALGGNSRQHYLMKVLSEVKISMSKQWHLQLQKSVALLDEIRIFSGSMFSFLGTLFCNSDYGDNCNRNKNECIWSWFRTSVKQPYFPYTFDPSWLQEYLH